MQVEVSIWKLEFQNTVLRHADLEDVFHASPSFSLFPTTCPVVVGDGSLTGCGRQSGSIHT